MKIINPANERVLKNIAEDNWDSIQQKYQTASQLQSKFQNVPLDRRLAIVAGFNSLLSKHEEKLAQILTSEMGKPITQSRNEIRGGRIRIQYFPGE